MCVCYFSLSILHLSLCMCLFFFSSRRRHTRYALVTGVQTCALPILPSKTTHNTLIEVIWTGIPVLILAVIAVPSIRLLAAQYEPPRKDALTIKVTGYQWYWGYAYPDQGIGEYVSKMLTEDQAKASGEQIGRAHV